MIENGKAKVLEFNVRFGDPETQVILMRLDSDLYDIMNAVATSTLDQVEVKWKDEQVTCVVLASGGYPGSYEKGKVITGLNDAEDVILFHAGTKEVDGNIVTNGGRVLNICALGANLEETRAKVYRAAEKIDFEGKVYRTDIGLM
jgi:phosphoribosylamine--glycine ligase